jgi:DnaJ-class molecular chaperone
LATNIDYYSLLGIKRGASPDEIKRAYRQLVFRYHPDRNPGNEEAANKFRQVLDAYTILSDSEKRADYDAATSPGEADRRTGNHQQGGEGRKFSENFARGFGFGQGFTKKTEAEPKCPSCAVVGSEHIVSRKGGATSSRGKQFVTSPFDIIFCDSCGHVYGVTALSN